METAAAVSVPGSGKPAAASAQRVAGEDALLVKRAVKGDTAAFETLYRHHAGRIYALCLRLAGDRSVAEECMQEAFITAWQKLDSFRGDSAFGSWLFRIATNTVMMHFRSQKRRDIHLLAVDDDAWERLPGQHETHGAGMDIEAALQELPEGARTVFVLHDVEGRRHAEIAELTGIAVGTSKAQLHRARRLLRERLEK